MKDVAKKYKRSDESEIKAEMFKIYKQLKDIYRDQAGCNSNGNCPVVTPNQLDMCMNNIMCMFDPLDSDHLH